MNDDEALKEAQDAIDHYREGLYRILRGDSDPAGVAASYLGEEAPAAQASTGGPAGGPQCPHCGTPRRSCEQYTPPTCGRSECQQAEYLKQCGRHSRKEEREKTADLPWECGCKIGFSLDEHDEVWRKFFTGETRSAVPSEWQKRLPAGWKPIECGVAGAAGYYIVFEVSVAPSVEDGRAVRRLMDRMKTRRRSPQ